MLEYEIKRSYNFNITASDQGSPSLLSNIAFLGTVQNANDGASTFPSQSVYSAPFQYSHWPFVSFLFFFDKNSTTVVRQIPLNTLIVTVEDPDSDLNSRIRYSLIQ